MWFTSSTELSADKYFAWKPKKIVEIRGTSGSVDAKQMKSSEKPSSGQCQMLRPSTTTRGRSEFWKLKKKPQTQTKNQ